MYPSGSFNNLRQLDCNCKPISRMIDMAKLLNESTGNDTLQAHCGNEIYGWQIASRALSSSLDEAILASMPNGRQKEFCIMRVLSRWCEGIVTQRILHTCCAALYYVP